MKREVFDLPINFVIPGQFKWPEMDNGTFLSMSDEARAQRAVRAIDSWVTLPYQYFKSRGGTVTHSTVPRPGVINMASGLDLGMRERGIEPFVVCARTDGFFPTIANYVIEHNGLRKGVLNTAFLTHPLQPGLVSRSPDRIGLKTVAYKGDIKNLDIRFRDESFKKALAKLGVELRIDDHNRRSYGQTHKMHDFSQVDAVIAARNMTIADAQKKPANKLINAWRAGVPALLGPEPAFSELRQSELDFFEIRSADNAIGFLKGLVEDPKLYEAAAENARTRGLEYTEDKVYGDWFSLFNGEIRKSFEEWESQSSLTKLTWCSKRYFAHRKSKEKAREERTSGKRILDA